MTKEAGELLIEILTLIEKTLCQQTVERRQQASASLKI